MKRSGEDAQQTDASEHGDVVNIVIGPELPTARASGGGDEVQDAPQAQPVAVQQQQPVTPARHDWREGRRIVEWGALVNNLQECKKCHSGPLVLSPDTIMGENICGLSGYLYIQCQTCQHVSRVAYGKTYHEPGKKKTRPCFVVNTKLGAG